MSKTVRFLHTADWQIGMRAAHVGAAGDHVRRSRLEAAKAVVQIAKEKKADFLVLAGDNFENNGVDRVLVQQVADILVSFGGPCYVLPGNHDPLEPGSVWDHPAWAKASNVHILRESQPLEIPGGTLYPCPAKSKYSRSDPTAWFSASGGSGIRIGIAHGTVEGIQHEELDFPIPRDAATRLSLDYLALGHWHSTATYEGQDGVVRMAYSGTHETTKFGERDSGNALLVEIASPGSPPVLAKLRTGKLRWEQWGDPIREPGDLTRLREKIESWEGAGETLLDLSLTGLLPAGEVRELHRLREILEARFFYHRMDHARLLPSPTDEQWISTLPAGVLRQTAERLRSYADPAFLDRPPEVSPEIAGRALLELCAISSEVTP